MKPIFNFSDNKITLLLVFTGFLGFWSNAQEFGLFHTGDKILQSANISPILLNDNKVNFGLVLNIKGTNNIGQKLKDVLVRNKVNDKINIIWKGFSDNAKGNNGILSDITINLFGLSFKYGKHIFSIHQNIRSATGIKYNEGLGKTLGNGIEKTTTFDLDSYSNTYHEIALGYKRRIGKFAIAGRLKYLNGLIHYSMRGGGTIQINPNSYTWTVSNNANSGFNQAGINTSKGFKNIDFTDFTNNHGGAIDIGVSFDVDEKLSFSLSANDIGAINWIQNPKNYILEKVTNTVYEGFNLDKENIGDIANTVKDLFGYKDNIKTTNSFVEILPINIYASSSYKLMKNHTINAIVHYQSVLTVPSFSLGYNLTYQKIGVGLHGAYHGVSRDFNIGGSIYVQPGALQFYLTRRKFT